MSKLRELAALLTDYAPGFGLLLSEADAKDLRKEIAQALTQKDALYAQRDLAVALAARLAVGRGFRVNLMAASDAEPGFSNVIAINLPTGQVTWHIHDTELPWFATAVWDLAAVWDGATKDETVARILEYCTGVPVPAEH